MWAHVRFSSSLRWEELKGKFCALCFSIWTSYIIEWLFQLWVCFWVQYSLLLQYEILEKLVTFMSHSRSEQTWIKLALYASIFSATVGSRYCSSGQEFQLSSWAVESFLCKAKTKKIYFIIIFFYVGTPSGVYLFDHLLWSIFQSSITLYNFFKFLHVLWWPCVGSFSWDSTLSSASISAMHHYVRSVAH